MAASSCPDLIVPSVTAWSSSRPLDSNGSSVFRSGTGTDGADTVTFDLAANLGNRDSRTSNAHNVTIKIGTTVIGRYTTTRLRGISCMS